MAKTGCIKFRVKQLMKRKYLLLAMLLLLTTAVSGLILGEKLADVRINIIGANTSVEEVEFSFKDLVSGDEFCDNKTTTLIVTGVRDPTVTIYPNRTMNDSYFDYLNLNISVGSSQGQIDMLNGGQFATEISDVETIDLQMNGKVGLVKQNVSSNCKVILEVNSGVQATGTISGKIVSEES